jgi:hypothetical protein
MKLGIAQLQELFERSQHDNKTLNVLQYELRYRNTRKARALKQQVDTNAFL